MDMDSDQSPDSQAAQACFLPAVVSSEPGAELPLASVAPPGPAQDPTQSANPILTPAAAPTTEGAGLAAGTQALEAGAAGSGLLHAGLDFAEGAAATKDTVEAAEAVKTSLSGATLASMGLAPTEAISVAAEGAPSFAQTAAQAQFAASAGEVTPANLLAPVSLVAGGIDTAESAKDISERGANLENVPSLIKGGLETTAGAIGTTGLAGSALSALGAEGAGAALTAGAAAAAPVAMVAGAGAGGMAIGGLMAGAADSQYAKGWGNDSQKTAMAEGASWGTWVDEHTGDRNASSPSVLGGIAAGAGGIAMGTVGAAQASYNWLKSAF